MPSRRARPPAVAIGARARPPLLHPAAGMPDAMHTSLVTTLIDDSTTLFHRSQRSWRVNTRERIQEPWRRDEYGSIVETPSSGS